MLEEKTIWDICIPTENWHEVFNWRMKYDIEVIDSRKSDFKGTIVRFAVNPQRHDVVAKLAMQFFGLKSIYIYRVSNYGYKFFADSDE